MSEPFTALERRVFQARGVLYEADVFSILYESPFVLRSFEFGLADGAIDCSSRYPTSMSFAGRLFDACDRRAVASEASNLLLFEVKNTVAESAGDQTFITSLRQQKTVGFWICITAADPTFIDLVPNFHQDSSALQASAVAHTYNDPSTARSVAVNVTRVSRLPPSAYRGLDQCGSPYRMPIWMLGEAIRRIRQCVNFGNIYVNPWTKVEFVNWSPKTTTSVEFLEPADHTEQSSAYQIFQEAYRLSRFQSSLDLDTVLSQPRLGDIRIRSRDRLVFVQHKIHPMIRSEENTMQRVAIARGDGKQLHHHFNAFERFDFVWFQFLFPKGRVLYFVPEKELPDSYYTSTEQFADFNEIRNINEYRIPMDDQGEWLSRIERIISEHPSPRQSSERPIRLQDVQSWIKDRASRVPKQIPDRGKHKAHGRHDYAEIMQAKQRRFFYQIMKQCALRKSGIMLVHATNAPDGEISYCRYRWTDEERDAFMLTGRPPRAAHHMPADMEIVPINFYTQSAQTFFQGPNMLPSQFRRLDSCAQDRLIVWNLSGRDSGPDDLSPAIIPTDDIRPTESQMNVLKRNLAIDKSTTREDDNPNLSYMFSSGLHCADYCPGEDGPSIYDGNATRWAVVWELLDRFTLLQPFEHPKGHLRHPHHYRHTLSSVHQRLQKQHEHCTDEAEFFS